eukprot:5543207-Prymnesium_polylepis.1
MAAFLCDSCPLSEITVDRMIHARCLFGMHRAYRDTCFFPAAPAMAVDAAVLVALRRQSSFSH